MPGGDMAVLTQVDVGRSGQTDAEVFQCRHQHPELKGMKMAFVQELGAQSTGMMRRLGVGVRE